MNICFPFGKFYSSTVSIYVWERVKLPCNGHVIDMKLTRCQVIITKGLSQIYQKKCIKVKILCTCNIEELLFQCKTKCQKINTIWKVIEDAYISIDCHCFLPIDRTLFLCLERIPYIVVSQEICSSNTKTLGLYLNSWPWNLHSSCDIYPGKSVIWQSNLADMGN